MILIPEKQTRVNDRFVYDDSIDATPIYHDMISDEIPGDMNEWGTRYQADFYKKFALDIVTETVLNYPYPVITEKTLRPIACKRMFIVLGPPGCLDLLRQKGFMTFDDFIDEDYDNIQDPKQRFQAVVRSVQDFMSMPLEQIKQYYSDNQIKFNHNFQTLQKLRSIEYQQICCQIGMVCNSSS
jgi:hypothetical protein